MPAAKKAAVRKTVAKKTVNVKAAPKLPPALAKAGDELYLTQQKRYKIQKEADKLEKREKELKKYLIDNLPKSLASGVAGRVARVRVELEEYAAVTDWDKLHGYVLAKAKRNPAIWSIFQRRISSSTVKDMLEHGEKVPGTKIEQTPVVRINKL